MSDVLVVSEVFFVKGRGHAVVFEEPLPEGITVHVSDVLRRADGAEWTVNGIDMACSRESFRAPCGVFLRGDNPPSRGDRMTLAEPPMTEEEYLRAKGWECSIVANDEEAPWAHPRHPSERFGVLLRFTIERAIAVQLCEDRRIYNFVRARSEMQGGMLVKKFCSGE